MSMLAYFNGTKALKEGVKMTYDEWLETPYYENDGKEEYSYPVDPDAEMERRHEQREREEGERSW